MKSVKGKFVSIWNTAYWMVWPRIYFDKEKVIVSLARSSAWLVIWNVIHSGSEDNENQ
jgi:hypothetical protein